jgi:hypothetical protein
LAFLIRVSCRHFDVLCPRTYFEMRENTSMTEQEWETIAQALLDPPMSRTCFYRNVLPKLKSRRRVGSKVIFLRSERRAVLLNMPQGAGPARRRVAS